MCVTTLIVEHIRKYDSSYYSSMHWWRILVRQAKFFFLSGISFTDTDNSQDSRKGPSLSLSTTSSRSRIFRHLLEFCIWNDYDVFVIASLVTRLLFHEIYHLWITISLIDDGMLISVYVLVAGDSRFLLQQLNTGTRWIWTRIDYHRCNTSKAINQLC